MPIHSVAELVECCLRTAPGNADWHQFDIGLVRVAGDARPGAYALFDALQPCLDRWIIEGRLHAWFFMRKPPDVRLRLLLPGRSEYLAIKVKEILDTIETEGHIHASAEGRYVAEEERFGGVEAMACVHAYFCGDSTLWHRMAQSGMNSGSAGESESLLVAILHHLFCQCAGNDNSVEGWQILANEIRKGGAYTGSGPDLPPESLESIARQQGFPGEQRNLLEAYARCNEWLGTNLQALALAGGLPRLTPIQVAALVALFVLNRHGISGERSGPMTKGVLSAIG